MVLFIAICESESMSVTPFSGRRHVGLVATKSRLSFAATGAKHAQWLLPADTRQAMLAQIEQAKGTLNARSSGRGGAGRKRRSAFRTSRPKGASE